MRLLLLLCLVTPLLSPAAHAASLWPSAGGTAAQIPPVEVAFQVQPAEWRDGRIHLRIAIAPNCYLYRDKLIVTALAPAGYRLGRPELGAGELIHDEHFGEQRIFRKVLDASWKPAAKTAPTKLQLSFQGCAEKLVCYPPQTRQIDVISYR